MDSNGDEHAGHQIPGRGSGAGTLQAAEAERRNWLRQAKDTGICPVREELYDQFFDELIRQITIDCKERGLLMVKVRDEMRNIL